MNVAAPAQTAGRRRESRLGLWLRLVVALGASIAAAIIIDRVMVDYVDNAALRGVASGLGAALLVGIGLHRYVITPLARSRAELQDRYQEALADALRDPLTGLGNHRAFQEELDRQVEAAQRYDVPVSLVILDLDEFKAINDSKGHAGGDRALARFGNLVAHSVRRVDRPFRIGGDEFAILLPHTDAEAAKIVTRRLLANALQPPLRDDGDTSLSFSAGISAVPEPAATRAQLYSQADAALYSAKRAGRTDVVIFDPTTEPMAVDASSSAAVAEVIARSQLRPVYQPIVELESGRVLGFEGLIRPIPPAPFVDPGSLFAAAAASGHLLALDMSCIETIVAGAKDLAPEYHLSVNMSPATIEAPEFSTAAVLSILARYHFPPERLILELTEQQPITDLERVRLKLETFRGAGIRLAADDVGAGNAGLRLLSEMRFDVVKVDLSLVQRSASNASSSAVVESVVSFASRTGALVVGEGVERPEQVAQLLALGVPAGQGYLLGRPGALPEADLVPSAAAPMFEPVRRVDAAAVPSTSAELAAWRQSIGLPAA
jgi:diguanylate cyclase (GGDEF)-like protein